MCNSSGIQKVGATPANVQWSVVRGDTATLEVQFLEDDEITPIDTSGWIFKATSYDPAGYVLDELAVTSEEGIAVITADANLTENWGAGYKTMVAELPFDLQVSIPVISGSPTIWTPIIGTISVLGDITPGGCL
jgi:hypothetical protein